MLICSSHLFYLFHQAGAECEAIVYFLLLRVFHSTRDQSGVSLTTSS